LSRNKRSKNSEQVIQWHVSWQIGGVELKNMPRQSRPEGGTTQRSSCDAARGRRAAARPQSARRVRGGG